MHLLVGLLSLSDGDAAFFGFSPQRQLDRVLPKIGFVAQDYHLYKNFTVAEMRKFSQKLNAYWANEFALQYHKQLDIPLDCASDKLSGGQQAQVALLLALAKCLGLLIPDGPLASQDPLARQHRSELMIASVLLVLVSATLIMNGSELRNIYQNFNKVGIESELKMLPFLTIQPLPLLLGIFVGAPLFSQALEQGTFKLTWTQGITRQQWIKKKLGLILAAGLCLFLILAGVLAW